MEYGKQGQGITGDAWQFALRFSLANAAVFLIFSTTLFVLEPESLSILLSAPALFFLGAIISFVMLIRSGGAFAAVAWFIGGAGIYFGLGVIVGALDPDPRIYKYLSDLPLYTDVMRVNLLNSSSVMLVLATAIPFCYAPGLSNRENTLGYQETIELLARIFPLMAIVSLAALGAEFLVFPVAGNLIVRVLLSSFYLVVPYCILAVGLLWARLDAFWAALGVVVFVLALGLALLSMSKFATMSILLAAVAGNWIHRRSVFSVALGVLMLGAAYLLLGGITDEGRSHPDYDAEDNSPITRIEILSDTIFLDSWASRAETVDQGRGGVEVPRALTRFSITAIQGFLIDRYEHQNPGTSLNDFWVAAIPRVLWPEKPIVTRFGRELHVEFWNQEADSALAPTYSGEAYWNYGPVGLVLVSILLGLEFGWFTRRWRIAASGSDPAFFLVAFPIALWAAYVESWIAASYIGGFLTLVVLWVCARFALRRSFGEALVRSLVR